MNKGKYIFRCVVLGVIAVAVFGLVTMWLWNWLIPVLFNGPQLNYWQTLGLLILSKILFSGLGGKRCGHHGPSPYWKQRFYQKFSNMSEADREAFKEKMKEKWCRWEQEK